MVERGIAVFHHVPQCIHQLQAGFGQTESQVIRPGMVAEVDILTGKRSLLSYLMKPVLRAKANALTER